jgi:hypothetical protein
MRLSRYFKLTEKLRLDLAIDIFNLLNRPNVDEVTSVYGSPVFCGAIPKNYKDATTLAIQQASTSVACPASLRTSLVGPTPWLAAGVLPVNVPDTPNSAFGKPRTMLNPRQMQFSAKLSF